jgi:ADP-heptose:LPS heptosyltransferase
MLPIDVFDRQSVIGNRFSMAPKILSSDEVRLYRGARGLGDALFVTTVAREIKKRRPELRVVVETHWQQIFHNNPDVAAAFPVGKKGAEGAFSVTYENPWPPERQNVLRIICQRLGLDDPEVRTYYYPTRDERMKARSIRPPSSRPLLVVHPFSGFFAARSKQWDFRHWKQFLELLPPEIETIRFGGVDEPATPTDRLNHREMVGLDLRIVAALLQTADAFVGQESGLAHLATALGVPSVVIFTGFVPPDVFGYEQNINLAPDLPYAPCWQKDGCPPCKAEICTRAVKPETVCAKTLELLERSRWK